MKGTAIVATGQTNLGGSGTETVATKVLHLVSDSFVGSVTIKARHVLEPGVLGETTATALTPVAIPYIRKYLNGAVSDGDNGSAAITGTSIIEVQCEGLEVILDCTAYTSGSLTPYWRDVLG